MLVLKIPGDEYWDEKKEEFITTKGWTLVLEHSLVSLAKWESKWRVPFLSKEDKNREEINDYIRFMTLTQNVDPKVYNHLTPQHYKQIQDYINAPMTATWFSKEKKTRGRRGEQVTAEIIYYWMIAHNIPFECQKWHLNRLLTLIKVCNIKNQPDKKMGKREMLSQRAALNEARRKRLGSRG